jgi:hypothetical protein
MDTRYGTLDEHALLQSQWAIPVEDLEFGSKLGRGRYGLACQIHQFEEKYP